MHNSEKMVKKGLTSFYERINLCKTIQKGGVMTFSWGVNSTKYPCIVDLDRIYPRLAFHGGDETEYNDGYLNAVQAAEACLNRGEPKCSSTAKLTEMVTKRADVEKMLDKIKAFEKEGYPLYNTVNLMQMKEAVQYLYIVLAHACKADLFIKVVDSMLLASKGEHSGKMTMKNYDQKWTGFEKDPDFSEYQAHARYFEGRDLFAIKLMAISGVDMDVIRALITRKRPMTI